MDSKLLEDIIYQIFPSGSDLSWDASQVGPDDRYWVIAGKQGPRWIIPQNPKYGLSVLTQWRPYGTLTSMQWQAFLTIYRIGQLGLLPNIQAFGISEAQTSSWESLGWMRSHAPVPVIYVGTPSDTRKAVISLVNRKTLQIVGIAKVPLTPLASNCILREAKNLTELAVNKPGLGPQLLFVNQDQGTSLQSAILGDPPSRRLTPAHCSWLSQLAIPEVETSLQEQVENLLPRLSHLSKMGDQTTVSAGKTLERLTDPTPLPSVWIHGDFAPWNLKWIDRSTLAAVDWEEARSHGVPLQDFFHYFYIQSYLFQSGPVLLSQLKQKFVDPYWPNLNLDAEMYLKLARFYLAESWVCCMERGDQNYATFLAATLSQM